MVILCNALCVHYRVRSPRQCLGSDLFWGVDPPFVQTGEFIMYRFTHWTRFLNCV